VGGEGVAAKTKKAVVAHENSERLSADRPRWELRDTKGVLGGGEKRKIEKVNPTNTEDYREDPRGRGDGPKP